MIGAALLALSLAAGVGLEVPGLIVAQVNISPGGCTLMALAPLPGDRCGSVSTGDLELSAVVYDPAAATCEGFFSHVAAGRHLLVLVGPAPDYRTVAEVDLCVPVGLDGRDLLIRTDHRRIFADGFEDGFARWAVGGTGGT